MTRAEAEERYKDGRRCCYCGELKPIDQFVWLNNQNKFKPGCRSCRTKRHAGYREQRDPGLAERREERQRRAKEAEKQKVFDEERARLYPKPEGVTRSVKGLGLFDIADKERARSRAADRYANDWGARMAHVYRVRLRKFVTTDMLPSAQSLAWFGCGKETFKQHIEEQLGDDMEWEHFKRDDELKLSLDHIVPVKWFDQTDEDECALCWHYQNIRPMRRNENISRGSKAPDALDILHSLPPTMIRLQLIAKAEEHLAYAL